MDLLAFCVHVLGFSRIFVQVLGFYCFVFFWLFVVFECFWHSLCMASLVNDFVLLRGVLSQS